MGLGRCLGAGLCSAGPSMVCPKILPRVANSFRSGWMIIQWAQANAQSYIEGLGYYLHPMAAVRQRTPQHANSRRHWALSEHQTI